MGSQFGRVWVGILLLGRVAGLRTDAISGEGT